MTCGLATALEPPHFNHAPVRGATPAPDLRIRGRVVSIHAPAWGATRKTVSDGALLTRFNPRTRVGCDAIQPHNTYQHHQFQSTHPRGVRLIALNNATQTQVFQSTHPRGVRRVSPCAGRPPGPCFNPRTRVGCDLIRFMRRMGFIVFQSTHPRGVRPAPHAGAPQGRRCFNPRTRVGCDTGAFGRAAPGAGFNPRTRVGCDGLFRRVSFGTNGFQSTHPRGVRL